MQNKVDSIKMYYEANMGKGLPDYSLLGWENEKAQVLRFEVMASNVSLQGKKILDVGCGLGNFVEYLNKNAIQAEYIGVDILQSMVIQAIKKNLNARFIHCDVFKDNPFKTGEFDVVYSSGIFNLNLDNNMEFLEKAMQTFIRLSDNVIAFNLLRNSSTDQEDKYFYYDLEEVRELIRKAFSGEFETVKYIDGYLQNDFTVICSKKGL
ncbi:MAG: class I SAM-dependent methyltransferase [Clostridia bacterium]|nr:class I SAM-dependent methyltransferase [Clostridia bacterium]